MEYCGEIRGYSSRYFTFNYCLSERRQVKWSMWACNEKCLHDSISSTIMNTINYDAWNSEKDLMYPTWREMSVDSFAKTGKHAKKEHCLDTKEDYSKIKLKLLFLR